MSLEIVNSNSTELIHLSSVDVKFSGAHLGGGIYFSANHSPAPGGTRSAIPQRSLVSEAEQHVAVELDFTLPADESLWTNYLEDIDEDGSLDAIMAGYDISLQIGERLTSTGEFYDGPSVPLLIANDGNDLTGTVRITGYPSATNSLNGQGGVLHQTTGTLFAGDYTEQNVSGDVGGFFTITGSQAVGGMSGGGNFLTIDIDGDGESEEYLIGATARQGSSTFGMRTTSYTKSTSFAPHYSELAETISALTGADARSADDFERFVMLSAQSVGSTNTTVNGEFFHEDIYGGVNADALFGNGGNDALFGRDGNDMLGGGIGSDTLDGGAGADTLTGGAGADLFLGGAGNDVITDFNTGEGDILDLSQYFGNFDDLLAAAVQSPDGSVMISIPAKNGGGSVQLLDTTMSELSRTDFMVLCYCADSLIDTEQGNVAVQDLRPGVKIVTRSMGFQPLLSLHARALGPHELAQRPKLWPVEIAQSALGPGVPNRALRVSPQHRIVIDSPISNRMAGAPVLLPAIKLVGLPGITQKRPKSGCHYYHLIFDRHQIVRANGCWSESFFSGTQGRKAQSTPLSARLSHNWTPAMPIIDGRRARKMVDRHNRNGKPLQRSPSPIRVGY